MDKMDNFQQTVAQIDKLDVFQKAVEALESDIKSASKGFAEIGKNFKTSIPYLTKIEPEYAKYLKPMLEAQRVLVRENTAIRSELEQTREELSKERDARKKADGRNVWIAIGCAAIPEVIRLLARLFQQ